MFLKNHPDVEQGNTKWLSETALSIPLNILSSLYSYAVETVKLKKEKIPQSLTAKSMKDLQGQSKTEAVSC